MSHKSVLDSPPDAVDLMAQALEELTPLVLAGDDVGIERVIGRYGERGTEMRQLLPIVRMLGVLGESSTSNGLANDPNDAPSSIASRSLGDYRLVREVGRGGMGIVFEAEQVSLGRRVALKLLPVSGLLDERVLARFRNEAQAAAALQHAHIVPIYGVGCEQGVHFYVMQLIEGLSLDRVIAGIRATEFAGLKSQISNTASSDTSPLALLSTERVEDQRSYYRRVAQLGIQVAEALHFAHECGVIHRDVKPGNLLLDTRGKLWVTDFGLARIEGNATLTLSGDLMGTLRYMSPEQAMGHRTAIDHRTDIYSLGATLYELLTLQPVFHGDIREELLRHIAHSEPRPARKVNSAIPRDLETILLKALAKEPVDRYPTAQALADDLRRFTEYKSLSTRRLGWLRRTSKWAGRNRPLLSAVAVGMFLTTSVLGGLVGWWLRERATHRQLVDSLRSKSVEAHRALGIVLNDTGKFDDAIAALMRNIELEPDVAAHHHNLGRTLHQKGDIPAAIAAYREAIRLSDKSFRSHHNLGEILTWQGQRQEGVAHQRKALAIKPGYVNAHYALGNDYMVDSNFADAANEYRCAIASEPTCIHARFNLGSLLLEQGRFSEALAQYRAARDLMERQPLPSIPIADAIRDAERMIELETKFAPLTTGEIEPASTAEALEFAVLCDRKQRYAVAFPFYRRAFADDPNLAETGVHREVVPSSWGDDLHDRETLRYRAARAALLAATETTAAHGNQETCRAIGIQWLHKEFDRLRSLTKASLNPQRRFALEALARWRHDPTLASIRDANELKSIPDADRQSLLEMWRELGKLLDDHK